jgi:hypothetical protein
MKSFLTPQVADAADPDPLEALPNEMESKLYMLTLSSMPYGEMRSLPP